MIAFSLVLAFAGCVLILTSWVAVIDTWLRTEDDL
jgi:hypothetical protein